MKKKIILDCDPGHDDAIAIMLAGKHPAIDLMGITVVSGNQTLEKTGKNTRHLAEFFGINVPISLGSRLPLVKPIQICPDIHGDSGLDGYEFPPIKIPYHHQRATDYIIDTLLASDEKIVIVTTGPMTNLALAMRIEPRILEHIEKVVVMGGSIAHGNVTPAAEFNIYADPEAAHIVFTSGVPIVMIGLDVTRQVMVLPPVIHRIKKINNPVADLFVKLMNAFNQNQRNVFGIPAGPLHDPVTIAYLIDPTLVTLKRVSCHIDLSHGVSYGRTNIDQYNYLKLPQTIEVAVAIDVDRFWNLIESVIKMYSNGTQQ